MTNPPKPGTPHEVKVPPEVSWETSGGKNVLRISGDWNRDGTAAAAGERSEKAPDAYDTSQLGSYDSTLPAYLLARLREGEGNENPPLDGLPDDLRGLMELALGVPERAEAREGERKLGLLEKLGHITTAAWRGAAAILEFTGMAVLSFGRLFTGRARFSMRDFWITLQESGAQALPIVSLISFLIGLILAFVGNVQLSSFGASIYVADLVGIAMTREMGVVMTSIIMSGRTGAAFAANLGSMKANQEIDALRTFGFDPFDYLVLPRMLALVLMMPILTVYSNIVGIFGGMLVATAVGVPPVLYLHQITEAVNLTTASLGVFKSVFFGIAIAICGCMQGMNSGNSSAAVGQATTKAVVAAITAVIVMDSAFAVIFTILGI